MNVVRLSDDTAHVSGDEGSACLYISFQALCHTVFYHVENRCCNEVIFGEVRVDRDHIDSDVLVIEVIVHLLDLVYVT